MHARLTILFVFITVCYAPLVAQQKNDSLDVSSKKTYLVSAGLSVLSMRSDLQNQYRTASAGINATFSWAGESRFNLQISLQTGSTYADNRNVKFLDNSRVQLNSFARNNFQSISINPCFHLIRKANWSIFIEQGFGLFFYQVYDDEGQLLIDQPNTRPPGESYSSVSVNLPTSIGGYYLLKNGFGVRMIVGFMNPQTDYLDNISEFGDPSTNDQVFRWNISLTKKLQF